MPPTDEENSSPTVNGSGAVLTSWKDIALYVGKGVRTVQRWEKEIGLPVRRPKQGVKSIVLAFPQEINDWVKGQKAVSDSTDHVDEHTQALLQQIKALEAEVAELKRRLTGNGEKTA